MKFNKLFTGLLSACLLVSTVPFASANEQIPELGTEELAYMDIAEAPELEDEILEAREEIIYGDQAWTVDGVASIINEDGTVEELPEFSDLFPGWDIPENNSTCPLQSRAIRFSKPVYFPAAGTVNAPKVYSAPSYSNSIKVTALTLPGTHWNVGFTNERTGEDVGWIPNIPVGKSGTLAGAGYGYVYSVRVSTYDIPGQGILNIEN